MDLTMIPLTALSIRTKNTISNLLNPTKYLPCDNGLPRDWRGLAHLANIEGELLPLVSSHSDQTMFILNTVIKRKSNDNIANLLHMLSTLERWDIIDDIQQFIDEDIKKYLECLEKSQVTIEAIEENVDTKVLTVDDIYRIKQGLENQRYDAFVLYANEDIDFANEMIDQLEKFNIKLCIKDRDLIGGINFEHEAVMTLISERCNRMIIIISPNFFKSSANEFFLNYSQAISIDKRQRKIIPCLYKKCVLPLQLKYMFILDYTRVGLYDFWERLRDSIQVSNTLHNRNIKEQELLKLTLKQETKEQSHETIPYLPSLDNLSTLSITIDSTDISQNICKENKSKKKKFPKIKTFKKMLMLKS
ncbi:myeloid differentiation primary response protein MyD88-like [Vespa mandarinia]|uniref:myeloid differentiation primary response protein MyD88-like n=1 Tax=Vespa mandarinia TaxID=7446 RepID=UPI00161900DE|nr:myeloid differentiation primary response protein MyD88-like [Vespa mandarinia]